VRALLDRARANVTVADLPRLLMSDPGYGEYLASYTEVLARGADALFEDVPGEGIRVRSFAITENLLLSHTDAAQSIVHRWFSVLTACVELLGAAVTRDIALSGTLGNLLRDTFALAEANEPHAPVDLLPALARELHTSRENPHERTLVTLMELLTAKLSDAEIEARCRTLGADHEQFQEYYDEKGEPSWHYAARPEFVLGAVVTRRELRAWLTLLEEHFPQSPALAAETCDRLLREGREWRRTSKK